MKESSKGLPAKEVLQGRFETEPRLERQLERTFDKIQRGLERIDNRFTPNVAGTIANQDGLVTQLGKTLSPSDSDANTVNAAEGNTQSVPVQSPAQTTQIEFSKTIDIQVSKSFNLSIKTQEGDTVNLSIEKTLQ